MVDNNMQKEHTYEEDIAYSEGHYAYKDCVKLNQNPYDGVSETLKRIWNTAWWDAFTEDQ